MRRVLSIVKKAAILVLLVVSMSMVAQPVAAQVEIPAGATIDSATFSIHVSYTSDQTVQMHRITAHWTEAEVTWNNFYSSSDPFDPAVVGKFVPHPWGWCSVDVTALVQGWVDGTYPNYGLLLEQGNTDPARYFSSEESARSGLRPKLEICYYTTASTDITCVTIQRPGTDQDGVADAWIWASNPNFNGGAADRLYTGLVNGSEKQSLLRFDFSVIPSYSPGTGTPGYWKNHPDAWPVDEITIGGVPYSKDGADGAIAIMNTPEKGDKTYTMFRALVAAKLNVANGNESSCIKDTISDADAWMEEYGPAGSGVKAGGKKSPWREGEPLYETLDAYNNGLLCAPPRE